MSDYEWGRSSEKYESGERLKMALSNYISGPLDNYTKDDYIREIMMMAESSNIVNEEIIENKGLYGIKIRKRFMDKPYNLASFKAKLPEKEIEDLQRIYESLWRKV